MRTRVGYAGGKMDEPTYHDLGDHTESIQIDFDPSVISFETICTIFWRSHNPCGRSWSRQYASLLFYANAEQKKIAEATRDKVAAEKGALSTQVVALGRFFAAEDYHQKYMLRRDDYFLNQLKRYYGENDVGLMNSTVAARLNSYLSGYGKLETLKREIDTFGLSDDAKEQLLKRVANR